MSNDDMNDAASDAQMSAAIAAAIASSTPEDLTDPSREVTVSESEIGGNVSTPTMGAVVHPTTEFQNLELGVDTLSDFANALQSSTQWNGNAPDPKSGDIITGADSKGNTISLQVTQPINQPATQQNLPNGASWTLPASSLHRPSAVSFQCTMAGIDFEYIELDVCVNGAVQTRKFPVLRQYWRVY